MLYYFDTSAIVKLYHIETGSEKVLELFENEEAENCISQITFTEFYCSLYRKLRNKEIAEERIVLEAIRNFEIDMQYEFVVTIDEMIYVEAKNLIMKYGSAHSLKTLDAVHLACVNSIASINETVFISADEKLCKVAFEMGLAVINPSDTFNLQAAPVE
ncbi:MAG: hypothetical protein JWQ09_5655 [Segetibacter sp.]|nr:hypothetical protein [Segetibacter sp.]